jgi:methionyl aminopeptidase
VYILKSQDEIEKLRRANAIVAETLEILREAIKPGISTEELDRLAFANTVKHKVKPGFLGYNDYPNSLCASVNEEVVHGIPSKKRVLKQGDIIGMDFGVIYEGFHGDAAITVGVGQVSEQAQQLMDATEKALANAIAVCWPGRFLGEIGEAVEDAVIPQGFSVVRQFVGHGIGRSMHESPQVPNYRTNSRGIKLKAGLVIAIEPMINAGTHEVRVTEDGWTAVTKDGKLSAHFEHSIAITEQGPVILSKI